MIIFSELLREALQNYRPQPLIRPVRAAVLIALIEDEGDPRLLLTRRAASLGSHSGEVAFPGGMMDPTDQNVVETALREATEEIGLPAGAVEILGQLDDMIPKSPQVAVTPIIGVIHTLPPLTPNPSEVARIFEIPLHDLLTPARWRVENKSWLGRTWPIYYFEHDGETLWGLSAYMTLLTLSLTPLGSPIDISWFQEWRMKRT